VNFENNNTIQLGSLSEENRSYDKINTTVSNQTINTDLNETIEPLKTNTSVKHGGMKLTSKKKDENRYY
jgi:hypothetical protein